MFMCIYIDHCGVIWEGVECFEELAVTPITCIFELSTTENRISCRIYIFFLCIHDIFNTRNVDFERSDP